MNSSYRLTKKSLLVTNLNHQAPHMVMEYVVLLVKVPNEQTQ